MGCTDTGAHAGWLQAAAMLCHAVVAPVPSWCVTLKACTKNPLMHCMQGRGSPSGSPVGSGGVSSQGGGTGPTPEEALPPCTPTKAGDAQAAGIPAPDIPAEESPQPISIPIPTTLAASGLLHSTAAEGGGDSTPDSAPAAAAAQKDAAAASARRRRRRRCFCVVAVVVAVIAIGAGVGAAMAGKGGGGGGSTAAPLGAASPSPPPAEEAPTPSPLPSSPPAPPSPSPPPDLSKLVALDLALLGVSPAALNTNSTLQAELAGVVDTISNTSGSQLVGAQERSLQVRPRDQSLLGVLLRRGHLWHGASAPASGAQVPSRRPLSELRPALPSWCRGASYCTCPATSFCGGAFWLRLHCRQPSSLLCSSQAVTRLHP